MNREEAFGVVMEALDLAQDLSGHAILRDPKNLNQDLSREELLEELFVSHAAFTKATAAAYELERRLSDWAAEYPLEEKQK